MLYGHVVRAVYGAPWAILPETLEVIASLVRMRASGVRLAEEDIQARLAAAAVTAGPRAGQAGGSVGLIRIYGTIMQRASLMSEMSGGTSIDRITGQFRQAMADDSIGSILFEVDSPGGEVGGVEELAAEIRAARGRKPMVAVANTLMASAAYWIASAADEIVATPSSQVGSIGVYTVHQDLSAQLEMDGVKPTLISAGKYKVEANPTEPLSDEARSALQEAVDDYYDLFTTAVAKGRGVTVAAVRNGFGEGRCLTAARAKEAGLVDRVDTFDNAVRRLASGRVKMRAELGVQKLTASVLLSQERAEDDEIIEAAHAAVFGDLRGIDTSGAAPVDTSASTIVEADRKATPSHDEVDRAIAIARARADATA